MFVPVICTRILWDLNFIPVWTAEKVQSKIRENKYVQSLGLVKAKSLLIDGANCHRARETMRQLRRAFGKLSISRF